MIKAKKMLCLLTVILSLHACEYFDKIEIGCLSDYEFENEIQVEDIRDAVHFVYREVRYKSDGIGMDYWQTPKETYISKTGDCEDKALLLMYLLESKLNICSHLFLIKNNQTGICHAMVVADDLYLNTPSGLITEQLSEGWETIHRIPYCEAIWMAINHHDNVGKYE